MKLPCPVKVVLSKQYVDLGKTLFFENVLPNQMHLESLHVHARMPDHMIMLTANKQTSQTLNFNLVVTLHPQYNTVAKKRTANERSA